MKTAIVNSRDLVHDMTARAHIAEQEQFEAIAAGMPQALYCGVHPHGKPPEFVYTWIGTPVLLITRYREWSAHTPYGGYYERCHIIGTDLAGRRWKGYGMGRGMLCRMRMVADR